MVGCLNSVAILGFHKVRGNLWLAGQLVVFQCGLCFRGLESCVSDCTGIRWSSG